MTRSRLGSKRQLPSGRWEVRVSHGYKLDKKPRTIREVVETEEDADRRIVELATELHKRIDLGAGLTLTRLWDLYRSDKGRRLAKMTMRGYESQMKTVWAPVLGDRDVSSITRQDIQPILLTMTRGKADSARRVLSSVLSYAVNRGWLQTNPMRGAAFEMPGDTGSDWDNEDVWDDDPFEAIEGGRDVWDAVTVLRCFELIRGLPIEPVWLAMVGGGLRLEEAFALRGMDVRRIEVGGRMVTQVAVHHAATQLDARKRTKTKRSVRVVAVVDPFGERLSELASLVRRDAPICKLSPKNSSRQWRRLFEPPKVSKHMPKKEGFVHRGALASLPYIPLSKMRATHETLMQEAGVPDSINAAAHGHSVQVARDHYMKGDSTQASQQMSQYLRLVQ